jgi:hypothetical protein
MAPSQMGLEADMTSSQVFDDIDDVANRPTKPVDTPDD